MAQIAEEVFELISNALAECERSESSLPAHRLLVSLGGVDVKHPNQYVLMNYVFTDFLGNSVVVNEKWHDPSGPYQNFPDIHRVRVTLQVFGKSPVERMVEYEPRTPV